MNKALIVILATIGLDAIGGGLIFPILPDLLQDVAGKAEFGLYFGLLIAVYAAAQFVFSPVLGVLSDRYGRRPVLILSLGGALIDYLFMALSPWGWVLVVGRAIAGMTSASMGVATAYMTDITAEEHRAQRFGLMGAFMGIGFVIGPALGGALGSWWVRSPFLFAAILNGLNMLLALFVLPESRKGEAGPLSWGAINPIAPLKWLAGLRGFLPLVLVFVLFELIATVPGVIWAVYGFDRFGWDAATIGLSLSVFGVSMAVAQALLPGFLSKHFSDMGTVLIGVCFDATAYLLMGMADRGWMAFALAPLFALGAVGMPAMQSILTQAVPADKQGELQGVLTSLGSLGALVGPVAATAVYFATRYTFAGTVWFAGAALYVLAAMVFIAGHRGLRPAAA